MFAIKLDKTTFISLVEEALQDIPASFAQYLDGVAIEVELVPDRRTYRDIRIDDPRGLLGLYRGRPRTCRSIDDEASLPDRITLYQRNIERMCRTREQIIREVRTTVFHEVGHHFGLEEEDLVALGYE